MTLQEMDREYLAERCDILNNFLEDEITYEQAQEELDLLDFKFETLFDIARLPGMSTAKPFDWGKD